ncbi:response regulator transcription factor [Erysipelothrix sp. HDW6B]|nr:response regulator transcription factor [Erysipelothrix sp. HDW6B]
MMKPHILIVEDDPIIQNLILNTLKLEAYPAYVANTALEGVQLFNANNPEIVILDLGLPDRDGVWVVQEIRKQSLAPIIVVSARAEVDDKIGALDAGADDYITKPFEPEELMARIRVAHRRLHVSDTQSTQFRNGNLVIDSDASTVQIHGQDVHVTPTEFKLLLLMIENVGKVLTYHMILKEVWGLYSDNIPALRVFVTTLRKKLEQYDPDLQYLQTHVGVGYRMIKH